MLINWRFIAVFALVLTSGSLSHSIEVTGGVRINGLQGQIDFTPAEIAQHSRGLTTLIETTNRTTEAFRDVQTRWLNTCGVGVMYGWLSDYSKLNPAGRARYIATNAKCTTPPVLADVKVTSCEVFTNKFLKQGFESIGQGDVYKRIDRYLTLNDRDGLALVFALRKLGWKIIYWNNDVGSTPPLPTNRGIVGLTPNDFVFDTRIAMRQRVYHGVPIDADVINFEPNAGSATVKDSQALARLARVPYLVGISHAGFHVWSASFGVVTESHSFFNPDSARNIEVGTFHPPHASPTGREGLDGGRMKMFYYYTGVIAVPPGPWLWF